MKKHFYAQSLFCPSPQDGLEHERNEFLFNLLIFYLYKEYLKVRFSLKIPPSLLTSSHSFPGEICAERVANVTYNWSRKVFYRRPQRFIRIAARLSEGENTAGRWMDFILEFRDRLSVYSLSQCRCWYNILCNSPRMMCHCFRAPTRILPFMALHYSPFHHPTEVARRRADTPHLQPQDHLTKTYQVQHGNDPPK